MSHQDIAYTARVNAAYWLGKNAIKIAKQLAGLSSEQQQPIEPESTHNSGDDHEMQMYISALRQLVPKMELAVVEHLQSKGLSPEESAKQWQKFCLWLVAKFDS